MPKDGKKTRTMILEETTQLVLSNGFAGTSIDNILERTHLTKGAFFYHFKNKADLAKELMRHFMDQDLKELEKALNATAEYSDQPRKRLIEFVQRFIDVFSGLQEPHAGCLYASYVYEPEQFSDEIKEMVRSSILHWRAGLKTLISKAYESTGSATDFDSDSLADLFSVILEGAFITSKALNDPKLTAAQLIHYRNYLELLFPKDGYPH